MALKTGTAGDDTLIGTTGIDILRGLAGNDQLTGGKGADLLDGSRGVDTVHYDASFEGVSINLAFNTASGGDAIGDTFVSIENVTGSTFADLILATDGDNVLRGLGGNDFLLGLAGNDTLIGGVGADRLEGDNGFDTVSYEGSATGVIVQLGFGVGHQGDAEGDTYDTIEAVTGSQQADTISGSDGINVLKGRGGADELKGLAGNDTLEGGTGGDFMDGGDGIDAASYAHATSAITLLLVNGSETIVGQKSEAQSDTLLDIETVQGTDFGDYFELRDSHVGHTLIGGKGNDSINTGSGADTVRLGVGNDSTLGGAGGDILDGGSGTDTLSYFGSKGGVTVSLATNTASGGHATGDVISSFENLSGSDLADTLTGSDGVNRLVGLGDNDVIAGQGGNDDVMGNGAADKMSGGAGADHFSYQSFGDSGVLLGQDEITDFSHAQGDKIDFSFMSTVGSSEFHFLGTKAGTQAGDVSFGFSGNDTIVTVESGAPNTLDMSIRLDGQISLVASDFIF
jgi:Ca2+-binding RTX toxin-like protein